MRELLLIISLFLSFSFYGQKYNFKNFDREEIKAKYIYDFAQDTNGILYAASSNGLLIYDGVNFKLLDKYTHLKNDFVTQLLIDNQNSIWLTYYESGLTKVTKTFNDYSSQHFETESLLSLSENNNSICVINSEYQRGEIDDSLNLINYSYNELTTLEIRSEIRLKNGKKVYLGNNGVYIKTKNKLTLVPDSETEFIKILKENEKNNHFAFQSQGQIFIYKYEDKLRLVNKIDLKAIGVNVKVTDLVFDLNKIFIATLGEGITEVKFTDQRLQTYSFINYKEINGMLSDLIQSLFLDQENNLWVGYYGQGISMFSNNRTLWYDKSIGLADNNVLCVTNFQGDLVVGTDQGFSILANDNIKNYNASTNFYDDRIRSLFANDNRLWVGTDNHGLFYIENDEIKPFVFKTLAFQPQTINFILIANSKLYLGTNTGLYIYSFEDGEEIHVTTNEGLVHNVIEYIYLDSKGVFWFDSPVSPIYSYQNGEFILYKDIKGFDSFDLSQIFETANKEIVFATMGDGLFIYKNGTFKQYKTQNSNILSNFVYFVVEDMNHQVWMGHKNGLSRLNIETNEFDQFSKKDNPLLKDVNMTSYQLSADNKLWIGTESGLVKLNSDEFTAVKPFPKLSYHGVLINDSLVSFDSIIELDYSDYQLEFKFQAVNLSNPKEVSYQYMLEGLDKQWNTLPYDKLNATYQSLIDGEYKFRLKVCLENSCDEKEITVLVRIKQPFWKSSLAIVLIVLLVLLVFFVVFYIINAQKVKQTRILELKVKRRTLELSKVNRLVEQKNSDLLDANNEITTQKKSLELKNKEIDDSIRYAKRIQSAFFVKEDYRGWSKLFKKSIVFHRPRNTVSGDFYWAFKTDDNLYLAVADCTGHGVPGAMLSMLGIAFLDEIMADFPNIETNDLLFKLRAKVIKELVHQEEDWAMQEGMDITLVRYNVKTKVVQWSGANNPLYIIRETKSQCAFLKEKTRNYVVGEYSLAEIKPDKQHIGFKEDLLPFTAHSFQAQTGDVMYLITDGYADQFGGENYKKFMTKRLKPLLISIHNKSEKEQYQTLKKVFTEWKGDTDQIDDVCIAGMTIN